MNDSGIMMQSRPRVGRQSQTNQGIMMRACSDTVLRCILLCVCLVLAACPLAAASYDFPVAVGTLWQAGASADGDRVVWMERVDHFNSIWQVWTHNFADGEHRSLPSPVSSAKLYPEISGSICVWEDNRGGDWDIYGYEFTSETEFPVCTDAGDQMLPRISGSGVVWQDNRNGSWDVYYCDLSTAETRQITNLPGTEYWPDISGNIIVWTDDRRAGWDIYSYDLSTGGETPICLASGEQMGVVSGNYVVWEDARNGNYDIYLYDISSRTERQVTSHPADQWAPEIDGSLVVWADFRNGNSDVFMLNLATGEESQVTSSLADQWYPVTSGGRIFWEDTRNGESDIYGNARTKNIVEAWRSPLGKPRALSVNTADGSCWAAAGASVIRFAADGEILAQVDGFWSVSSISTDPGNDSCWVADTGTGQVVHLRADGTEQWRGDILAVPLSISVNPSDGSCWVVDPENGEVVRLAADGTLLWTGTGLASPVSVAVNANDDSCWVADAATGEVAHIANNGARLWQGGDLLNPSYISVNSADGSCWILDNDLMMVVHLASDGHELWRGGSIVDAASISVDSSDGSCWIADRSGKVLHLSADGTQILVDESLQVPQSVSVDPISGSCWAADFGASAIALLASNGDLLMRENGLCWPLSVAANATDGGVWVSDTPTLAGQSGGGSVIRLDSNGDELMRASGLDLPVQVASNGQDSCWVADAGATAVDGSIGRVALVNDTGSEIWSGLPFLDTWVSLAPDPADGSCWVARGTAEVAHVGGDGSALPSVFSPGVAGYVAANSVDGSCWVSDFGVPDLLGEWVQPSLVHFSADGSELRRTANISPETLAVSPSDGSCWVYDAYAGQIVHFSAEGSALRRIDTNGYRPRSIAVSPVDGSCWVAETADFGWTGGPQSQIIHFASDGTELWRGTDYAWAVSVSVDPSDGSCWIADQYNGQVVRLAITDPLVAVFAATPVSGVAPLAVAFDNQSGGYPTAWSWNFGDGAISTERAPAHDYTRPGYYGVSLTTSSANGSSTAAREHYIRVYFPDVSPDPPTPCWAADEIIACATGRIVGGYEDGLYHPEIPVTRDQMAVFIARALVRPNGDDGIADPPSTPTFPDVSPTHWAYKQIEYVVSQKVVQGYDDGEYKPGLVVTRDQMAVYIARAIVAPSGEAGIAETECVGPPFPDVPCDYWARKHIQYCIESGVVKGYDDGYYRPTLEVTRDQMAVYIRRAFGLWIPD